MAGADQEASVRLFPESSGIDVVPPQSVGAVVTLNRAILRDHRDAAVTAHPRPSLPVATDHKAVVTRHAFGLGEVNSGNAFASDLKACDSEISFLIDQPNGLGVFGSYTEHFWRTKAILHSESAPVFTVKACYSLYACAPQNISEEVKTR